MQKLKLIFLFALITSLAGCFLTAPQYVNSDHFAGLTGDATHGEQVFHTGGCASCHAAPDAKGDDKYILSGGLHFATPFGTFIAPNISPSSAGIKGWSLLDLANAMQRGVSPTGKHYYPAFPYTSYIRMKPQDVADLYAYLNTLPASDATNQPHDLGFPFNIRRGMGLWKRAYMRRGPIADVDTTNPQIARGQYLVEGAGHCGECHTPRRLTGGLKYSKWLAGGPNPDGPGTIPNITPHALEWSVDEITEYLTSGFTPDFDSAGGSMVAVQENMAKLPAADREAIAAYLKAVAAVK
jgi:mono/diheme cytochrome c family protein